MEKIANFEDIPDRFFLRLLRAVKDCPKTASELEEKTKREDKEKYSSEQAQLK